MPLLLPSGVVSCDDRFFELLSEAGWIELAEQFNLAAAFFVSLQQRNVLSNLTTQAQEKLQRAYEGNAARQIILCELLARILHALQALSQPPILLKGLAYAYELYPEPNTRVVGDIDLLLSLEEREFALEQLVRQGCKRLPPLLVEGGEIAALARAVGLGRFYDQFITPRKGAAKECATSLTVRIGGQEELVEIHHNLIGIVPESVRGKIFHTHMQFEGCTRSLPIEFGEVRVLNFESAFLHAVRHLALHHRFIGFRWHHDLALMLVNWGEHLNPESILKQAQGLGSRKIVRVELAILEELFGPTIFHNGDREGWLIDPLPVEYALYRRVAVGEKPTPMWKLVKPLLAPSLKEQIMALFY